MSTVQHARKIRVMLADDHETILARVRSLLDEEFDIIGLVRNGRDAVSEVQRLQPDVLVTDISMPILDGLQAVSKLQSISSRTKVVFLTVHEDPDFVAAALSVGASGYVTKANVTRELIPAIREAFAGRIYISQSIPHG
jgi:DNA-binding NarL/FixJ family response regulator